MRRCLGFWVNVVGSWSIFLVFGYVDILVNNNGEVINSGWWDSKNRRSRIRVNFSFEEISIEIF